MDLLEGEGRGSMAHTSNIAPNSSRKSDRQTDTRTGPKIYVSRECGQFEKAPSARLNYDTGIMYGTTF